VVEKDMENFNVDKSGHRVRRMFGEIAGRYDFLNHFLSLGIDRWWRRRTVRTVRPEGEGPILDVCTGTADLALAYHRAARGRVPVVGLDFCRPMLAVGRRKIERLGLSDQVSLIEGDAQALPFDDDYFQIVSVAFGIRNVCDTDRGLREMFRVCRPGGKVAVLEFSTPRFRPVGVVYQWYFHNILPRIGQTIAKNASAAYNYLPASVFEFAEGEAFLDKMRVAGARHAWCRRLSFGVATLYVGEK